MNALWGFAVLLVCPLTMGAMMLWMMRGGRRPRGAPDSRPGEGRPDPVPPAATPTTRYVRNVRPSALTIWALGARFTLAERGAPGDVLALPQAAFRDPDLLGYLDLEWIEEVDERVFLTRSLEEVSRAGADGGSGRG